MLEAEGFTQVDETAALPAEAGRYYLVRGGSLVAWSTEGLGADAPASASARGVTLNKRSLPCFEPVQIAPCHLRILGKLLMDLIPKRPW